jgi:hypothetical protein
MENIYIALFPEDIYETYVLSVHILSRYLKGCIFVILEPCHSLYFSICDCTYDRVLNVRINILVVSTRVCTPFCVLLRAAF